MSSEQFSLVWNSFPKNLSSGLYTLLTDEHLIDVTLAVEGKVLQAHKLILSVCSPYFKELFKMNSCKHPIVILKDVHYRDLSAMLDFMYQGEVNIKQEDLTSFLELAKALQIKALIKDENQKNNESAIDEIPLRIEDSPQNQSIELHGSLEQDIKLEPPSAVENESQTVTMENKLSAIIQNSNTINSTQESLAIHESKFAEHGDEKNETVTEPYNDIDQIWSDASDEIGERKSRPIDDPLDYTSDIGALSETKNEPPDNASDINFDRTCNMAGQENPRLRGDCNLRVDGNFVTNDYLRNSEALVHNLSNQNGSTVSSHFETSLGSDFSYNGSYRRGRRKVKGLLRSTLPLETTLQVVSELGPTLRVERGKVMRMYSCPWCLHHFTRKENLKLHVRHIHGPLESLTCKLCGKKYKNDNSLRVHAYIYHNTDKRNKHSKPLRQRVNSRM